MQPTRWPGDDDADNHDFRVVNDGKRVGRIELHAPLFTGVLLWL
jgi:hypothetical protein